MNNCYIDEDGYNIDIRSRWTMWEGHCVVCGDFLDDLGYIECSSCDEFPEYRYCIE